MDTWETRLSQMDTRPDYVRTPWDGSRWQYLAITVDRPEWYADDVRLLVAYDYSESEPATYYRDREPATVDGIRAYVDRGAKGFREFELTTSERDAIADELLRSEAR